MTSSVLQALIWSKMSTGLPIEILSSMKGQNYTSFCRLDIDIHRYEKYGQTKIKSFLHICVVFMCEVFFYEVLGHMNLRLL